MSGSGKRGYNPSPPEPARLNIDEIERLKKLFEDSPLAKYIKWAGWGALAAVGLELVRIIWLAYRYLHRV
jgi:hypothetical protein